MTRFFHKWRDWAWNQTHLFVLFVLFLLACLVRLEKIDKQSISMDEDRQAEIAGSGFDLDLPARASKQHQPPIDYYAEALGLSIFGMTEYGARVHAAVWGALTVVIFFLLLKLVFYDPFPVVLGTLLMIFDRFLISYSQEGRPISCGMFFETLYFYSLFRFLLNEHPHLINQTFNAVFLLLSNIGLMLSVGFQPFVLIATVSISLMPTLFFRRTRVRVLFVYLVLFVSVLVAWPTVSMAIHEGASYIGEKTLQDRLLSLLNAFDTISKRSWTGKYQKLFNAYHWLFLFSLGMAVAAGICRGMKNIHFPACLFSVFISLAALLFPPILDMLFHSQIEYSLKPRYYAMYQPILFMALTTTFFYADNLISFFKTKNIWAVRSIYMVYASLIILLYWPGFTAKYTPSVKADWRSMYSQLKAEGKPGDMAYMLSLVPHGRRSIPFYSTQFYYPKKNAGPTLKQWDRLIRDYKKGRLKKSRNIFLVTAYGYKHVIKAFRNVALNFAYSQYTKMSVTRIGLSSHPGEQVRDVFKTYVNRLPKRSDAYRAYRILAELQIIDKQFSDAKQTIQQASLLDKSSKYQRKVIGRLRTSLKKAIKKNGK